MERRRSLAGWIVPVSVLLLFLLCYIGYQWAIPRTDLEVRTVYHESPGGGGTGGSINVNILLTNQGNREVSDLSCSASVVSADGVEMVRGSMEDGSLKMRDNAELKLSFIGSHYHTYRVAVHMTFVSRGNTVSEDIVHMTEEDSMNMVFADRMG